METIESFNIDHSKLLPGLYVSRKDSVNEEILTTFDIRLVEPNKEPVLNTSAVHSIEHIAATYLRNNDKIKDKVIYFGPMGCRTGFYLILAGDYESKDIVNLLIEVFTFIKDYNDDIPGNSHMECGNYLDHNLNMAKYHSKKYLDILKNINEERLKY